MTDRFTLTVNNPIRAAADIKRLDQWAKAETMAGNTVTITGRRETRSAKQNAMMWSCLTDLSNQVTWFGKKLTKEGWKDFITGHLDGQDLVPNMDGTGFISIQRGRSTSTMTIREMVAVIDLCHAFGADQGVSWSPTSLGREAFAVDPATGEVVETRAEREGVAA